MRQHLVRPKSRYQLCVTVFAFCIVACDGIDSAERSELGVVDSAGVLITTSDVGAVDRILGEAQYIEGATIGCSNVGPYPYLFSQIRDARLLGRDVLVVLDAQEPFVRVFRPDGTAHAWGSTGQGPRDFQAPLAISPVGGDSAFVVDRRLSRVTLVSSGGEFVRAERHVFPPGVPLGVIRGRVSTVQSPLLFGAPRGRLALPFSVFLESAGSERYVEIGAPLTRPMFVGADVMVEGAGMYPRILEIPYTTAPTAAVGEDLIYVTDGFTEIRGYDPRGGLRHILRIESPRPPPTRDQLLEVGRAHNSSHPRPAAALADYRDMPLPARTPWFSRVLVGRDGRVWAQLFEGQDGGPVRWLVFGASGEAIGVVVFPNGFQATEFTEGMAVGTRLGQMGEPSVQLLRLPHDGKAVDAWSGMDAKRVCGD